jgi:hypothetical protein
MKKNILTLILLAICWNSFGQFVGNEQQVNTNSNSNQKEKNSDDNGVWNSKGYFAFNIVRPYGDFGRAPRLSTTNFSDIYNQKTGFGAENGYGFEFGKLYFLNNLVFPNGTTLPENMRFGINANWFNMSFMKYNWEKVNSYTFDPSFAYSISVKLGGFFSYNIKDKLFVDACFNVAPTSLFIGSSEGSSSSLGTSFYSNFSGGFGFKYDVGFNIRYSRLLLGCFFNMGKTKHTFSYYDYTYYNYSSTSALQTVESKFKSSSFNIKLGFLFR